MAEPRHLLRPFVGWPIKDRSLEAVESYLERVRGVKTQRSFDFGTWTSKHPSRADDLIGNSVYFVHKRRTLFRMAILEIVREKTQTGIIMEPFAHPVERKYVGMVRGWRYLRIEDAPPDLPPRAPGDDELPPKLRRELTELGL